MRLFPLRPVSSTNGTRGKPGEAPDTTRSDSEGVNGADRPPPKPTAGIVDAEPVADAEPVVDAEPAESTKGASPPRRRFSVLVIGLSLATVVVLALGVVVGLQWQDGRDQDRLRQEAINVARMQSVNLMTINPDNIDKQLQVMLDGATGEFQRQFTGVRDTFAQVVRDGKVSSEGSVDEAGISQLADDSATVLVAVRATVKNAETPPEGKPRLYRISVELQRKDDRWLVSGMQFVP